MNEDPRQPPAPPPPPVAIRITRPYATEEELLQHEPETLTRTGVTLLGAQQRPQGVVLRFELVLSTGNPVLRGEGRVVAYKPSSEDGLGGLTLRFTRLDSRSKSLVDKAAALRDQRRQSMPPPGSSLYPSASMPPAAPVPIAPVSEVTIPVDVEPSSPSLPTDTGSVVSPQAGRPAGPSSLPPPLPMAALRPGPMASMAGLTPAPMASMAGLTPAPMASMRALTPAPIAPVAAMVPMLPPIASARPAAEQRGEAPTALGSPPDREALLGRLRSRARGLDSSDVARILERK